MTLARFKADRRRLQSFTWPGLAVVTVAGWFQPLLGFLLIGCMLGALGIAAYGKGRMWCDWMCPRGSFFDLFLDRAGRRRKIPALLRSNGLRIGVTAALFAALGVQILYAWPDPVRMGLAFVIVLTVTTSAGIALGIILHPRAWCHVCPMGTIAGTLSKNDTYPLAIDGGCTSCGLCGTHCPMGIAPYVDREHGRFRDTDCVKCATCVAACPVKALSFGDGKGSGAGERRAREAGPACPRGSGTVRV